MAMYPSDRYYTREHEWVQVEGDLCTVGITHFAQEELGEIVFFEPPEVGQELSAGDEMGSIESVKAVAEVYTPVSGEVVEINEEAREDPALVNEDPHGRGWLVRIRIAGEFDPAGLMRAEEYTEYVRGEE